jgi:hypothetical protein
MLVWNAFVRDRVFVRRHGRVPWTFANGTRAEVKVDADKLHPISRGLILGAMAMHPCVQRADLLVGVPNGMIEDISVLADRLGKKDAALWRPDYERRHEYVWANEDQEEIVAAAEIACVLDDITTTGSSAHATALCLQEVNPHLQIHSLSMLLRGVIAPAYISGSEHPNAAIDEFHMLCKRYIPTGHSDFVAMLGFEPATVIA